MTDDESRLSDFLEQLFKQNADRQQAIDRLHAALVDRRWLSRVTVHKYLCRRGEPLATVFQVSGLTLCHARDYKLSPGLNEVRSVAAARAKNTLDGDRHWPSHVYDVEELARFNTETSQSGLVVSCRHFTGTLLADDILSTIEGVTPGRPKKPTRLVG